MEGNKGLLILAVPLASAGLLAAAIWLHRAPDSPAPRPAGAAAKPLPVYPPAPPAATPRKSASPEQMAVAVENVRIRGTYQNYRQAVATNNPRLQGALLPVLLRDRAVAQKLAQEDLVSARTQNDRDLSNRVIEALRN